MTCQEAFDIAAGYSNLNDPNLVPSSFWLGVLSAYEQRLFRDAAAKDPTYFGRITYTESRLSVDHPWDISSVPAASIYRVEVDSIVGTVPNLAVGEEVFIVDLKNLYAALRPRVFLVGRKIHEAFVDLRSGSTNFVNRLRLYYSYVPPKRTSPSEALEVPDQHILSVILPLAGALAVRDQRPDEAAYLHQAYQEERLSFLEHLSNFTEGAIRV